MSDSAKMATLAIRLERDAPYLDVSVRLRYGSALIRANGRKRSAGRQRVAAQ